MVTQESTAVAEWISEPGCIVERGLIMTAWEIVIDDGAGDCSGVVDDDDCVVPVAVCVSGGAPITLFSAIIHSFPIDMGPSNEYILARGWMIVDAPIVMGCVP